MGSLLILVALGGFVVGLVSLVRPIQKLRIRDRRHAAIVLAASFFVMTVGVVVSPEPTTDAASPTTTAPDTAEATTTRAPTTTMATTTTQAPTTTRATTTTQAVTTTVAPTTTTTEPEIELPESVLDEIFLFTVRGQSEEYDEVTWVDLEEDEVLISLAHQWCDQFDEGSSLESVGLAMIYVLDDIYGELLVDADYELVGYAIGAGVVSYCPEHTSLIEGAAGI